MNLFSKLFRSRDKPYNHLGGLSFLFGQTTAGKAVNERTAIMIPPHLSMMSEEFCCSDVRIVSSLKIKVSFRLSAFIHGEILRRCRPFFAQKKNNLYNYTVPKDVDTQKEGMG